MTTTTDEILQDRPDTPFLVCAFYTDTYAAEAAQLRASLERTGTPYFLKRCPSRGYWEANTRIKPEFLRDCLQRFAGRDVVYLDADSVVRSPLRLFFDFDADLGVFVAPGDGGFSHRYLTGTLYLRNGPPTRAFVDDWIAAQDGMLLGVDQDSFTAAIERHPALSIGPLPESYVKIFDRGTETPVVEHFQASRRHVKLQRAIKKVRNVVIGAGLLGGLAWLAARWF
ncbi:MAG: hypothetical protein JSR83_17280 [Proteobacteria bacterium]|nr:hypothetical protein [Pseudomonadota bacterium]